MNSIFCWFAAVLMCGAALGAVQAQPKSASAPVFTRDLEPLPDGVRWDRVNKRFIYSVLQTDGTVLEIPYTPRNQTSPRVTSKIRFDGKGFDYGYKVSNHRSAAVAVSGFLMRTGKLGMPDYPIHPEVDYEVIKPGSSEAWVIWDDWKAKTIAYQNRFMFQPNKDWKHELRLSDRTGKASFYWNGILDSSKNKRELLLPGEKLKTIGLNRAELPGALLMSFGGWTPDSSNMPRLPNEGPAGEHAATQISNRHQDVAVLGPAIILPTPYDGAELMRRVKTHVDTWAVQGLTTADMLPILQARLVAYIAALAGTNKAAVREAATALLAEMFVCHPGFTHRNVDEDDDDVDEGDNAKVKHDVIPLNPIGNEPAIHRVAVRALSFNVLYALTRAEIALK